MRRSASRGRRRRWFRVGASIAAALGSLTLQGRRSSWSRRTDESRRLQEKTLLRVVPWLVADVESHLWANEHWERDVEQEAEQVELIDARRSLALEELAGLAGAAMDERRHFFLANTARLQALPETRCEFAHSWSFPAHIASK